MIDNARPRLKKYIKSSGWYIEELWRLETHQHICNIMRVVEKGTIFYGSQEEIEKRTQLESDHISSLHFHEEMKFLSELACGVCYE